MTGRLYRFIATMPAPPPPERVMSDIDTLEVSLSGITVCVPATYTREQIEKGVQAEEDAEIGPSPFEEPSLRVSSFEPTPCTCGKRGAERLHYRLIWPGPMGPAVEMKEL